jgi:hypothetical protein
MTRSSVGMVVLGAVLALMAYAGQAQGQVTLEVDRIIQTTPFVNSAQSMRDGEGMAYVRPNDTLWLGDDSNDMLYEVDRGSGNLLSVIEKSQLANAVQLGGTERAGTERAADIEALAYDSVNDVLYVKSTPCCPKPPTAFRLVRSSPEEAFQVETYQPLEKHGGCEFTGAGFHPKEEKIYVSCGGSIRPYDYVTNTLGPSIPKDSQVSGVIFGLGFSEDGKDLWQVTSADRLYRIDWATKGLVPGYSFDLRPYGIPEARAVDVIEGQVYVLNGDGEINLTVFNVVTAAGSPPAAPSGLTATAISGTRIDLTWTDRSDNEAGFSIELCPLPASSCGEADFGEIHRVEVADVTTYSDVGLVPNTIYTYRVRAYNAVGQSAPAGPATAQTLPVANLLQNPSFESDANGDGLPDVWTTVGAFTRSSEVVRSGSFAGKHFATTNANYSVKQSVGVTAGASHSFSGCANIPPTTDAFTFRFHLRWLSASGTVLAQKTLKTHTAPTGGAWECVTTTGMVAPAGTTQAEVRMVAESINLTIYVDDLVFEVE